MMAIVLIMVFLSSYMMVYAVFGGFFRKKQIILIRLDKISKEEQKDMDSELNQPIFVRVVRPILFSLSRAVLKYTPKEIISNFERKVVIAGNPYNLTVNDWINIQLVIMVCLLVLTAAIGYIRSFQISSIVLLVIIEVIMSILLPRFILNRKTLERQRQIRNSMPDVLDLLTVSVEAGLGFDGALAKVIDKMPGALANEFENVLQEIKVGKQKKDALKDMAQRVNLPDLTTFIGSIIQADQLGVSIGNVLRIQSEQMRQKRRQRAQEKAMKAPVKMLIPMVLFIFPTLFSVLIGPVLIKVIDEFSK
ncbi:type II secretion system F family protein [Pseudobacteroides cellulosolvens]|uniref:Type II secretion system F domain-containing protein n=1 Tax=Pseudobacteroides cellulosolvens ATCC 35603 = DSM 2933 TaxID=398512 RepID=A0A0L6JH95_9FIRM|nr:type II secretion system F family protein [Pseudobacteroides cellulosolvens]KNY25099.1 Type II secretion system F domain-containing protein [Pseudobacteroides cellulosolvens ATCC 35603 = DSM 2933]